MRADIKALITITNKDCVYTGYRPAHLINGYLTTGLHEYIDADCIRNGESKEGFITFISRADICKKTGIASSGEFSKKIKRVGGLRIYTEIYT